MTISLNKHTVGTGHEKREATQIAGGPVWPYRAINSKERQDDWIAHTHTALSARYPVIPSFRTVDHSEREANF